jgi:hypothetical protein
MEIQIPGDVPLEDHDRYVQAFWLGYRFVRLYPETLSMDVDTIRIKRDIWPEAYDAGVSAAWKKKK